VKVFEAVVVLKTYALKTYFLHYLVCHHFARFHCSISAEFSRSIAVMMRLMLRNFKLTHTSESQAYRFSSTN
jgi:hypothetical protein